MIACTCTHLQAQAKGDVDTRTISRVLNVSGRERDAPPGTAPTTSQAPMVVDLKEMRLAGGRVVLVDHGSGWVYDPPQGGGKSGVTGCDSNGPGGVCMGGVSVVDR